MKKATRYSQWGPTVLFLAALLLTSQSAMAERISLVNLLDSGTVEVSVASNTQDFSTLIAAGESSGYVSFGTGAYTLTASQSGQAIAELGVNTPDNDEWTYVLAENPEGMPEWYRLPDHNHPIDTFSFQVTHLASNVDLVRFTRECRTRQGDGARRSSAYGFFGLGTLGAPAFDKPLSRQSTVPFDCEMTAFSEDDTPIASSPLFDSVTDQGNAYRLILVNDSQGGARFLTFLQENRPTRTYRVAQAQDSGLYFSPRFKGTGWALLVDGGPLSVMYFGFDVTGQPTWGSTTQIDPFFDGSPSPIFFDQYQRNDDGLLVRSTTPLPVKIAAHGCSAITVFSGRLPDPLLRVTRLLKFPQDALPLQGIYEPNCIDGEKR